jgi:hypothetical protein
MRITGRIITVLVVSFLVFDAVMKLIKEAHVVQAFAELGYPLYLAVVIGTILLACVVVYVIPQTSALGAVLLTGYLGGAVDCQLRAGKPLFDTLFPFLFGMLVWAGLYLRDERLQTLVPVRK